MKNDLMIPDVFGFTQKCIKPLFKLITYCVLIGFEQLANVLKNLIQTSDLGSQMRKL